MNSIKRKKIIMRTVIMLILVAVIGYISESIYLGINIQSILNDIYDTQNFDNSSFVISDDILYALDYRHIDENVDLDKVREENTTSFPLVLHWIFGAQVYYHYTYKVFDKNTGENIRGSQEIPVRLYVVLENNRWVVKDFDEAS